MAVISLMYNKKVLKDFPIGIGDTFLIGRQESNDIVIDSLAASSRHAKIESIGDEFLLIDLQSENGSFVNDRRIKTHWLNDGDSVAIGKHTLLFSHPKNNNLPKKMFPTFIETMQMDTAKFRELMRKNNRSIEKESKIKSVPAATLVFLSESRKNLLLGENPVRIGKALTSDILVHGIFVGKTAAVINWMGDGWHVSRGGGLVRVKVNGKRVKSSVKLNRLDIISVGKTKMQFVSMAAAY
jgi:pSer/pThr/pTyr-binding forkhead associated (FHA) protein